MCGIVIPSRATETSCELKPSTLWNWVEFINSYLMLKQNYLTILTLQDLLLITLFVNEGIY